MEANFISKNYTADVELYFDYNERKASMKLVSKNLESFIIYNYQDDEIYAVESKRKKVFSIMI